MHITSNTAQAAPWYTHRWPWFLMLGPALVLVGGVFVTWLALGHPDAMVVDDYYKQGKAINQDLRRDRAASAMHLVLQLRYEGGRLQGRIESFGRPLSAPFTLRLAHPTLPERDLALPVRPDADGRFSVPLPVLEQTHWQVVAEGTLHDWRLAKGWSWPRQRELAIVADPV
ncbi:FixH family protein [Massilia sp. LXY-6]|uniref:FixH family protein n=1 Tax=Massilia sp. LXY-6 TaxID=3379823 RepID=UPI003EE02596